MIYVENVDAPGWLVDAISDAIFTSACPPLTLERSSERAADTDRVVGQRTKDELDAGRGGSLGEMF